MADQEIARHSKNILRLLADIIKAVDKAYPDAAKS
jgi:hypothetical protein